jgi:thymidylate synthase (FAD)
VIIHTHDGDPEYAYLQDKPQLLHHIKTAHADDNSPSINPWEAHGNMHRYSKQLNFGSGDSAHKAGPKRMTSGPHHRGDVDLRDIPAAEERKQLTLWADPAMKSAVPQPVGSDGRVRPTVHILQATPDPLGTLAAIMSIYKGGVKRSLAEVSDEERREALAEMLKTKLQGPLEAITFTILIEGVTRSFTHQMVRGRAAFYAQESMRFAVPDEEEWTNRVSYPPSLSGLDPDSQPRYLWDSAVEQAEFAYKSLVNMGIPAEDARGLMPHAMTTRLVWQVSLRELLHVAGLRLCTQSQFEWRTVLSLVVRELRAWGNSSDLQPHDANDSTVAWNGWQFGEIADLLRPVCYAEGKCGFMSSFDRGCKIRDRVEIRAQHSSPAADSKYWDRPFLYNGPDGEVITSPGIQPEEWLADPSAAR